MPKAPAGSWMQLRGWARLCPTGPPEHRCRPFPRRCRWCSVCQRGHTTSWEHSGTFLLIYETILISMGCWLQRFGGAGFIRAARWLQGELLSCAPGVVPNGDRTQGFHPSGLQHHLSGGTNKYFPPSVSFKPSFSVCKGTFLLKLMTKAGCPFLCFSLIQEKLPSGCRCHYEACREHTGMGTGTWVAGSGHGGETYLTNNILEVLSQDSATEIIFFISSF